MTSRRSFSTFLTNWRAEEYVMEDQLKAADDKRVDSDARRMRHWGDGCMVYHKACFYLQIQLELLGTSLSLHTWTLAMIVHFSERASFKSLQVWGNGRFPIEFD